MQPLSCAQRRMWFLHRLQPLSPAYAITSVTRLRGPLDVAALRRAVGVLIERHESLRSGFAEVDGVPMRTVVPSVPVPLEQADLRACAGDSEVASRRWADEQARRLFALDRPPLLRAALATVAAEHHLLVLGLHHIVADGWSLGILHRELGAAYAAALAGEVPELGAAPSFAATVERERAYLAGSAAERALAYWSGQLEGLAPSELPLVARRPAEQRFAGGTVALDVSEASARKLEALAAARGASLYMVLAASFAALLGRYSGEREAVFGTPVANRDDPRDEDVVGLLVNTAVLRVDLGGEPRFEQVLQRVRTAVLDGLEHQAMPFDRVVEAVQPQRASSHNPLFQTMLALQNHELRPPQLAGTSAQALAPEAGVCRFDLECTLWRRPGEGLALRLLYNHDLLGEPAVRRLGSHYLRVLDAVVRDPGVPLARLPLLAGRERAALTREGPAAPAPPAGRWRADQLVSDRALETPHATALICSAETLAYAELELRAERVAAALERAGVGPGDVVGIALPRGSELVVGMLATLRVGAAILPLSPTDPEDRRAFLAEEAGARVLLADGAQQARRRAQVASIDVRTVARGGPARRRAETRGSGADACAVIYTSGTSGRPKGVVVEHRNLLATLLGHQAVSPLERSDTFLCLAAHTFDVFYFELLAPLVRGAACRLLTREETLDPAALVAAVRAATGFHAVPGLMEQVLDAMAQAGVARLPRIRTAITGGDLVPGALLARMAEAFPAARLAIAYGPTETTIFCTRHAVDRARLPERGHPIGTPLPGVRIRIAGADGDPLPRGVPGEILIAGAGVTRGYLRRPAETAARFVTLDGERFYRSGDRGRLGEDGAIEFLGRDDLQLKVRGLRIESTEVEAALATAPGVSQAAVAVRGRRMSEKRLTAYAVVDPAPRPPDRRRELERAKAEEWRMLFEQTHTDGPAPGDERDYTGWRSSLTGAAIPRAEMDDWLAGTLAAVRERLTAGARVLELGCGTGLLLCELAGDCSRYVGVDFARTAVAALRERVARRGLRDVELLVGDVGSPLPLGGPFDLVIVNSVAQYLPSAPRLEALLDAAAGLLAPDGALFVGDVRSLPLLETFHATVALARARDDDDPRALLAHARQRAWVEDELVLDPRFFAAWAARAGFGELHCSPRRGTRPNELLRYRYDVALRRRPAVRPAPVAWCRWERLGGSPNRLVEALARVPAGRWLGVECVPNGLLTEDRAAHGRLRAAAGGPPAPSSDAHAPTPQRLRELARAAGCALELSCARAAADGSLDAVFRPLGEAPAAIAWPAAPPADGPLASDPLRRVENARRELALHDHLRARLAEYMVPASVTIVPALPRTANGKVDRALLPDVRVAEGGRRASAQPRTATERLVASVLSEVLGARELAVDEDFFGAGGTSLLAIQAVVRLRARGVVVTPQQLLGYRTIADLARHLDGAPARVRPPAPAPRSLPPQATAPRAATARRGVRTPRGGHALLTGATGFLGGHVLAALLESTERELVCLVRGVDDGAAEQRLREQVRWQFPERDLTALLDARVRVLAGDLVRPRLGLSEHDWRELARACDAIFHAAADVRHVAERDELFAVNLDGTETLLQLACDSAGATLHHVSTIGVKGVVDPARGPVVLREHELDVGQLPTEAYSASKLAAERSVREHVARGGRACVYRVGTVAPHARSGRFQRNAGEHFLTRYLRGTIELGLACRWPDRELALSPVDVTADAIVRLAHAPGSTGRTFHLQTPHALSHEDLVAILHALGYSIRLVEPGDFADALARLARDDAHADAVGCLLPLVDRPAGGHVRLDSAASHERLQELGIAFPVPTTAWLVRFVQHCVDVGYLPAPRVAAAGWRVPEVLGRAAARPSAAAASSDEERSAHALG